MKISHIFRTLSCTLFAAWFMQGFIMAQEISDSIIVQIQGPGELIIYETGTGYTKQQTQLITGSVSVVEREHLKIMPSGNVVNQLQGMAPGVSVIGSGLPGETSKIFIRGIGSLSGSQPLFIVDGIPLDDIATLNPNDIETIVVLKDAGAAAIYGARALNGVVVINTRQGWEGLKVTYDMFVGTQLPGKGPTNDLLNTQERADLQWLVYKNDRMDGTFDGPDEDLLPDREFHPIYGLSANPSPELPGWAAETDWYDEITDPAGIHNHDLTLSGAGKNARYYLGLGYYQQNGMVIYTNSRRFSSRLNTEFTLFKGRVKIGENLNFAYNSKLSVPNLTEGSPIQMGPYRSQSIIPVYITTEIMGTAHNFLPGEFGGGGLASRLGNSINVVANRNRNRDDVNQRYHISGNIYADIKIFNGLKLRSSYGGTRQNWDITDDTYGTYENAENIGTRFRIQSHNELGSRIWSHMLVLDKGQFQAFGGYENIRSGTGRFKSRTIVQGSPTLENGQIYFPLELESGFLSASYALMDKYLVGFAMRLDHAKGPSTVEDKVLYPSFSAGWRIKREPFMRSISWLNDLKIRGSYGKTGNVYGNWEYCLNTNIGFDAVVWDNHFGIAFDWYQKKSQDVYVYYWPPAAPFGLYINSDGISNTGIEMKINYNQTGQLLGLNVDLTVTTYRNKITRQKEYFDSGSSRIGSLVRNRTGQPLSSFFGYQVEGLFQSDGEISGAPLQDGAGPGFFRFANLDTDNAITPDDRTFLGDPHPDFTAGMNIQLTYKNFDLGALLYWSQGNDIFNWNRWWTDFWPSFEGQKSKDLLYNSWTETNKGASTPKASNTSNFSTNTQSCSYYIEDGSYLRLKSLQMGYTFDEEVIRTLKMASLRIYVQAVNLFTLTKYTGLDPEIGGNDYSFGIDYGNYPNVKQFLVGLQVGF